MKPQHPMPAGTLEPESVGFPEGLNLPQDPIGIRHLPWSWLTPSANGRNVVCGAHWKQSSNVGPSCVLCLTALEAEAKRLAAVAGLIPMEEAQA